MVVFWVLFAVSAVAVVGALSSAFTVYGRFRKPGRPPEPDAAEGLSLMVPIKGADSHTPEILDRLVRSEGTGPVEYLIAMESADDPAYPVARRVQEAHPGKAIRTVLTGQPETLMGKQHNLAVAFGQTSHPLLGSMDADVQVEPDTLAEGLRYVAQPGTGVAFFLPAYAGEGPVGGTLVALYTNYYFCVNMGALALRGNPTFVIGALWLVSRQTLDRTDGFGQFGLTVSDDAIIGRAVAELGLRNVLVPRTVKMPMENLDLVGGVRHLRKWLGMLRAEGLPIYLSILFLWHPVLWAAVTAVVGLALGEPYRTYGLVLAGAAVGARLLASLLVNTGVYRQPALRHSLSLLAYELVAVPVLFTIGLFTRTVEWKGRRYRIGRQGRILAMEDVNRP